jgi:hypothetical protein
MKYINFLNIINESFDEQSVKQDLVNKIQDTYQILKQFILSKDTKVVELFPKYDINYKTNGDACTGIALKHYKEDNMQVLFGISIEYDKDLKNITDRAAHFSNLDKNGNVSDFNFQTYKPSKERITLFFYQVFPMNDNIKDISDMKRIASQLLGISSIHHLFKFKKL